MSTNTKQDGRVVSRRSWWPSPQVRWPMTIIGLILMNVCVCGITVYSAIASSSGATVEPDYDRRALNYDATAREIAASDKLGWASDVKVSQGERGGELLVTLTTRDGRAVDDADLRAVLFHQAHADQQQAVKLLPESAGVYRASFRCDRAGYWEVRITAQRTGERFSRKHSVLVLTLADHHS